jgi:hypothetical protein
MPALVGAFFKGMESSATDSYRTSVSFNFTQRDR